MNTLYVKVIKRYNFFSLTGFIAGNLAKIKDMMWWELQLDNAAVQIIHLLKAHG